MPPRGDTVDAIKKAQKIAEESAIDDKYKPALFYFLLTKSSGLPIEGGPRPSIPAGKRKGATSRASAPAAIRSLHKEKFFKDGKTIDEVTRRLGDEGFHFGYETTKKALQRAEFLRGEGERRSRKFYQRYPPP